MNLYSPKTIKQTLKEHNSSPKDHLGQNFLVEKRVASALLRAAELSGRDTVLEVGPGMGTLTQELAGAAGLVIAVEKDPVMVEILKETVVKEHPNVKVLQGDILKMKFQAANSEVSIVNGQLSNVSYRVVANLPYYITSPVLRMFLEAEKKPELLALMVQKEVAQRICAKPPDMSMLAVSTQFYAVPKIIAYVRKTAFWPRPKVDSAIVKIVPNKEKPVVAPDTFFRVVKAGFKQPRKQLANNLATELNLSRQETESLLKKADIKPEQRAETLSLKDWINLAKEYTMGK
ncbi:MAG: ribosomal RNA small subunit methyltransferase A [Candidatus Wildermuthbacteria bacterium RIFCSPHIGHO2_01_FULL_49_22b]|uniref:Ribosomal RNA small subunit methyltransferase A n=1 Tax=Candidatus Wildermuthbacteria bacterium RIFCSPHIGHO2_01_FULL_49_22b TaxID=1802448 RepID=A0A1G2QY65_9BACT|nr:MAG: ribosomal RNA small subunit methyltransferase A [Candidatus Wildermuthbacteria bacterium RIFCSPHIGHO2_01_FULL_49_22b]